MAARAGVLLSEKNLIFCVFVLFVGRNCFYGLCTRPSNCITHARQRAAITSCLMFLFHHTLQHYITSQRAALFLFHQTLEQNITSLGAIFISSNITTLHHVSRSCFGFIKYYNITSHLKKLLLFQQTPGHYITSQGITLFYFVKH